jgi:hypothetical protein
VTRVRPPQSPPLGLACRATGDPTVTAAACADLRAALSSAFGGDVLARAFLAVRRHEWEALKDLSLEEEVARFFERY